MPKSGAADVLSSLGIKLDCEMALVSRALDEAGICFLMAPRHHSAMRHVGPVRAELGVRSDIGRVRRGEQPVELHVDARLLRAKVEKNR